MWKNTALALASLVLALTAADYALGWLTRGQAYWKARELGVPYDTRDRLDVILENRKSDPNWHPGVPANTWLEQQIELDGQRVIPLGGVANANVVGCNEGGSFSTFTTDEAGFRNPRGTWPLSRPKHVFLVGDSFTQGDCVKEGGGIADQLRRLFPQVVNLGVGGNGPLLELAGVREYVPAGRVSHLLWMYYEGNDLMDLERDRRDPILTRYLEDQTFSQRLQPRQDNLNAAVREFVSARTIERAEGRPVVAPHLRGLIYRIRNGQPALPRAANDEALRSATRPDVDTLVRVIEAAKREVESKGGKLVFVYLPEYFRLTGKPLSSWAQARPELLRALSARGVEVLDLEPALRRHPRPAELFPLGLKAHYNEIGYGVIADSLARLLDADKTNPN